MRYAVATAMEDAMTVRQALEQKERKKDSATPYPLVRLLNNQKGQVLSPLILLPLLARAQIIHSIQIAITLSDTNRVMVLSSREKMAQAYVLKSYLKKTKMAR